MNDPFPLLIACCQSMQSTEERARLLSMLSRTADHASFIVTATAHGILPLVYQTLKSLAPHDALTHALKSRYQSIAHHNILLSAELLRTMRLLQDHGIPALAFKGPVLAQMAYGDITLRQYGDLDILIQPSDLLYASKLLVDNGYEPRVSLEYLKNKTFLDANHDMSFYKNVTIELHWRLFEEQLVVQFDSDFIWTENEIITIQNQRLKTLSFENLLVYLCIHGSKHAWERIEWIADLDRLIHRRPELNWGKILQISIELKSEHLLLLGLNISQMLFHTDIPSDIQKEIKSNKKVYVLQKIVLKYLKEGTLTNSDSKTYYQKLFYFRMQMQKNWIGKVEYAYKNIIKINSSDIEELDPGKHTYWDYYFGRLSRLIRVYITKHT